MFAADEHGDDLWWQVQKSDGTKGVVPGGYLVPADDETGFELQTSGVSLRVPLCVRVRVCFGLYS